MCIRDRCYIGDGVVIGNNTTLYAGVKIYQGCVVGENCILHSGVVVGLSLIHICLADSIPGSDTVLLQKQQIEDLRASIYPMPFGRLV